MTEPAAELVKMINGHLGGYNTMTGLRFVHAEPDEVVAKLEVSDNHLQPYGLVHGGVLAGMVESLCSVGAAISVIEENKSAVGLENSTSFLRAVRSGTLHGTARPVRRGRRTHVWAAEIRDDRERLVATGHVRLLVLDSGVRVGGEEIQLEERKGRVSG
jgi:1,4-dihydroxy-2-naphthoyl-CoA hydrolase